MNGNENGLSPAVKEGRAALIIEELIGADAVENLNEHPDFTLTADQQRAVDTEL